MTYHESSSFYGKTSLLWHQEAPTGAGWSRDADVARPVRIIDDHTRTIRVIHWGLSMNLQPATCDRGIYANYN